LKKNILYISYDSIEDSISKSQIIPLLKDLSKIYEISLISFEKKKIHKKIKFIKTWNQIEYKQNLISKLFSIINCFFLSLSITKQKKIKVIHCRSYLPALIAYLVKKRLKVKYIFDIRGLWFNEKYDAKLINKFFFNILKIIEKKLYQNSDHIITLSLKSIKYISNEFKIKKNKINYVSCFTDSKKFYKSRANIKDNIIFGYFGNVKLSYNFNKVLNFFNTFNKINKNWRLIFANNDLNKKEKKNIFKSFKYKNKVFIVNSNFETINKIYEKINIGIYFLKEDFSKIASCPTKLGEMLSCGIPVITNKGIGDINIYINDKKKAGFMVNKINYNNLNKINNKINNKKSYLKLKKNAKFIANEYFEKNKNILKYKKIYNQLI
tara:strand:+ start:1166 stop:2305 length:1140 start_codon:yes stop_codon:yes gene_type:complete